MAIWLFIPHLSASSRSSVKALAVMAIMGISAVIVVFAGVLTAVVIYTLTNINISERNREIATLMVLGYYDREVTSYIYREVYVN